MLSLNFILVQIPTDGFIDYIPKPFNVMYIVHTYSANVNC